METTSINVVYRKQLFQSLVFCFTFKTISYLSSVKVVNALNTFSGVLLLKTWVKDNYVSLKDHHHGPECSNLWATNKALVDLNFFIQVD